MNGCLFNIPPRSTWNESIHQYSSVVKVEQKKQNNKANIYIAPHCKTLTVHFIKGRFSAVFSTLTANGVELKLGGVGAGGGFPLMEIMRVFVFTQERRKVQNDAGLGWTERWRQRRGRCAGKGGKRPDGT